MNGRCFEPLADKNFENRLIRVAEKCLLTLASNPPTKEWLPELSIGEVVWTARYDEMTSRHTPDRESYVVDVNSCESSDPASRELRAEFSFEWVHDEDSDRRSHMVFFKITYRDHDLQGMVMIPLEDEAGKPDINIWSIVNL